MADLVVIEELQDYLVAEEIAQLPGEDASADLPSVWMNPRDGAPAPREVGAGYEKATITLSGDLWRGDPDVAPWMENTIVDVVVRAYQEREAILLQRDIAKLVEPYDQLGGRKQWEMNDLLVERSYVAVGDQRMSVRYALAAQGLATFYDRVQRIVFECRRKSLAGTPYVP